jgi:hypothetical protein
MAKAKQEHLLSAKSVSDSFPTHLDITDHKAPFDPKTNRPSGRVLDATGVVV